MNLLDVLEELRDDIDQCYFAVCFEMESGLPLGIATSTYHDRAEAISGAFGQMMDIVLEGQRKVRDRTLRRALEGFRELILETTESTFFIMVPEVNDTIAVAIGVPQHVKLGYARVAIGKHYPRLLEALSAVF